MPLSLITLNIDTLPKDFIATLISTSESDETKKNNFGRYMNSIMSSHIDVSSGETYNTVVI